MKAGDKEVNLRSTLGIGLEMRSLMHFTEQGGVQEVIKKTRHTWKEYDNHIWLTDRDLHLLPSL